MSVNNPFRIPLKNNLVAKSLEMILGLKPLAQHYDLRPQNLDATAFLAYTQDALGLESCRINFEENLKKIPKDGPLIIVANHPLGGLEGVVLSQLLLKYRPDLKVLTNKLLTHIPEFKELFIGVNVLAKDAKAENFKGIKTSSKHLSNGGALLIFPAGKVSSLNIKKLRIEDIAWNRQVGLWAKKYESNVLPIRINGLNSFKFYLSGLIHPRLRTLLLPREFVNKRGKHIDISIGNIIEPKEIKGLSDAQALTNYFRLCTDLLKDNTSKKGIIPEGQNHLPISKPPERDILDCAVNQLSEYRLIKFKHYSVYCVPGSEIGVIRNELAFARELTFRTANEGTGQLEDWDEYNEYYLQLFVYDHTNKKLAGAYRMAETFKVLDSHGVKGLYSNKMYNYDEKLLRDIGPALEVGRSFVHPDYQKRTAVLDLLWKGIGTYVALNNQITTVFGGVSISQEYSEQARVFIADSMLSSFKFDRVIFNVAPKIPLKVKSKLWSSEHLYSIGNVPLFNKLLGQFEQGKVIPILIRHYLALNGKFVCFSVNQDLNESLDGLILVDFATMPAKYLKRYLGEQGSIEYKRKWSIND
ncbi:lysophospholipid acyltransferase family protein [Marinicellulosiphila megalodicopiae]|uniref:lysophospholipid acyltransferase family protein n=1 Tax=Marinicellulosiphila megalodicopiae TaxID=2724896 RepID=UPI003BB046BA